MVGGRSVPGWVGGVLVVLVLVASAALPASAFAATITTFAGVPGVDRSYGDGGPATRAGFSGLSQLAADGRGDVFITDAVTSRIREVKPNGRISTFARLASPATGIALDARGRVYVAEPIANRVVRVSRGGATTTVAGDGREGFGGDGGPATAARLDVPSALAFDSADDLFIVDSGNQRIRKVGLDGTITTVAGDGVAGYSGDGGPATAASLHNPADVSVNSVGDLYIADASNNRVRMVTPAGRITTVVGSGRRGFSGDGGPATAAALRYPVSLAIDAHDKLYVGDLDNHRVRVVSPAGIITTFAGNGKRGVSGDGGRATRARITSPSALAADRSGHLYIADIASDVIRRVGPETLTSGRLVWTALGGRVTCGLALFARTLLCASPHIPPPRPDRRSTGDSGFVFLRVTGRPSRSQLSQNTWFGSGANPPRRIKRATKWRIRGGPICSISVRAVRCHNRSHHGFTITRRSYRAF